MGISHLFVLGRDAGVAEDDGKVSLENGVPDLTGEEHLAALFHRERVLSTADAPFPDTTMPICTSPVFFLAIAPETVTMVQEK